MDVTQHSRSLLASSSVRKQQIVRSQHLSLLLRLYIYSLHGYFVEVTFTAIWDFVLDRDWKLKGCSSIWSLAVYGSCGLALEELSIYLRHYKLPLLLRGTLYLLLVYFWEFTWGYILTYLNCCPWDYSEFSYNIGGLITLEYAPLWLLTGLVTERVLIGRLEQLRWSDSSLSSDASSIITTSSSENGTVLKQRIVTGVKKRSYKNE